MPTTQTSSLVLKDSARSKPVYTMAIVCENPAARTRAEEFSQKLIGEMGEGMVWSKELWDFAALDAGTTRRAVTQAAANADVFILAFDGDREFHDDFKAWIEQWGGHLFERSPVLIALFNTPNQEHEALITNRNFLSMVVDLCGLTFLYTVGDLIVEHRPEKKNF